MKISERTNGRSRLVKSVEVFQPPQEDGEMCFDIREFLSETDWDKILLVMKSALSEKENKITNTTLFLDNAFLIGFLKPEKVDTMRSSFDAEELKMLLLQLSGQHSTVMARWLFPDLQSEPQIKKWWEGLISDVKNWGSNRAKAALLDPSRKDEFGLNQEWLHKIKNDGTINTGDDILQLIAAAVFFSPETARAGLDLKKIKNDLHQDLIKLKQQNIPWDDLRKALRKLVAFRLLTAESITVSGEHYTVQDRKPKLPSQATLPARSEL